MAFWEEGKHVGMLYEEYDDPRENQCSVTSAAGEPSGRVSSYAAAAAPSGAPLSAARSMYDWREAFLQPFPMKHLLLEGRLPPFA